MVPLTEPVSAVLAGITLSLTGITGFSDPVSLTVCPYLARRPARTLWGRRPQAPRSRTQLHGKPRGLL